MFRTMAGLFLILILCSSCQLSVAVKADLDSFSKPCGGTPTEVTLLAEAMDIRGEESGQVGRHTFSLFMIPTFRVTAGDGEALHREIASHVRVALQQCGYTVKTVEKIHHADRPVLVVQIDVLKNYLFSWIYPLGLTWGSMDLSLHLMSPDAQSLWVKKLEGHWGMMPSLLYMSGFETRVKSDLTSNIEQIVAVLNSSEFRNELRKAQAGFGSPVAVAKD